MASKCASENRSIGKGNKDEHGHMSDSFYNHEGRLAKKSNRIGNMENDDHERALER